MTKIVIGALSCQRDLPRRIRCRQCWAVPTPEVEILFFIGDPTLRQPERRGDEVWLPCPDGYAELPQKTRGMCQWFLDYFEDDYLFKCDDDTYVCLDRLLAYSKQHDYIGLKVKDYASGGAGYFLSRKAAAIVARELSMPQGCEDLLVGRVLRETGIVLHHDRRFGGWPNWDEIPRVENERITTHGWRNDKMLEIHRIFMTESFPRRASDYCSVTSAIVPYGGLGLHGKLGYTVDGKFDVVATPSDQTEWQNYDLISGHAPSQIVIANSTPVELIAAMDQKGRCTAEHPTRFEVDGRLLGECKKQSSRTPAIQLLAGTHELKSLCSDPIARRYSFWAIRKLNNNLPHVHSENCSNELENCISFSRLGKHGRLGNQLFQYALLCGVAQKLGCEIMIPDDVLSGFDLLAYRVPRAYLETRKQRFKERGAAFNFDPRVFEQPAGTDYFGYFQSYHYFEHAKQRVRREFSFVERIQQQSQQFVDDLRRADSRELVFVSVRRTDYVRKSQFHRPFEVSYFEQAKKFFDPNVRYVFSSDDMDWTSKHLVGNDCIYLRNFDPLVYLCIGTLCDHYICSASTFSWWAAWLGETNLKRVVIPDPWYGPRFPYPQSNNQMSPPHWIRCKPRNDSTIVETQAVH